MVLGVRNDGGGVMTRETRMKPCPFCESSFHVSINWTKCAEGFGCAVESIRIERVCYLPADEGEPPESQARVFIEIGGGEACTRPIKYCPMCGKEL